MLHLDSQCSAGFSNLVLPCLGQDGIQKKEGNGEERDREKGAVGRGEVSEREKEDLCCGSNPYSASSWLRSEGPFKLPSSPASTELSSSGKFAFLQVSRFFHDDSSIHYE